MIGILMCLRPSLMVSFSSVIQSPKRHQFLLMVSSLQTVLRSLWMKIFWYMCLKHRLKGKGKGETEVFMDNRPGGPDNINLAPDGSFWIELTSHGLEFIHISTMSKTLLASYPKLVPPFHRMISNSDDSDGTVLSLMTFALEYEERLYRVSLNTNPVGKLALKD
ncbi:hypothetical protein RJ641_025832 [Dillenia turbinata]|uniref:Adipocyte plasma membrane-associated protein n=1 Tax=Dillenia turbinata TaxID=194707 RepID=A0AAN8ZTI6_9MAGN